MFDFDYCHFCKHENNWEFDSFMACDGCNQRNDDTPTEFIEKDSVKAYRKAMAKHNGACWGCECKEVKKDD